MLLTFSIDEILFPSLNCIPPKFLSILSIPIFGNSFSIFLLFNLIYKSNFEDAYLIK